MGVLPSRQTSHAPGEQPSRERVMPARDHHFSAVFLKLSHVVTRIGERAGLIAVAAILLTPASIGICATRFRVALEWHATTLAILVTHKMLLLIVK